MAALSKITKYETYLEYEIILFIVQFSHTYEVVGEQLMRTSFLTS
jgi:hypothetical protein